MKARESHEPDLLPKGVPSVSCHNGCQTYMRYKLMRLLMNKQRMKAVDEVGFHRDVRQAVKRKHERKIRYD